MYGGSTATDLEFQLSKLETGVRLLLLL
jgi:hypothetical protein